MLLTTTDWRRWFDVSVDEAARLIAVQEDLLGAGFCPCPDAVVGMSRSLLREDDASAKLRVLADLWEVRPVAAIGMEPHWPDSEEPTVDALLRRYRWLRGDDGDPLRSARCRHRRGR